MALADISFTEERRIYTISELNTEARVLLETHFASVWVEGEISNLVKASSGHWYFSLKDKDAQIRCAMFRHKNQYLRFTPENGLHVIVRGKISLYENRGDFQLIADNMEEAGFGRLQQEFDALYAKLQKEGLFEEKHKKPLPRFPKQLGIITSPTGAVIHDILTTLKRRFPLLPIIIYPSLVQGKEAASSLIHALQLAEKRQECDLLIMARGGGSKEDLWPFNDEHLARAIFNCSIPIISGVGHEIDFTITDFVADHRAPTPTGAAEVATPFGAELLKQVENAQDTLLYIMEKMFAQWNEKVLWLKKRLIHPGQRLEQWSQRLDFIEHQLVSYALRLQQLKHNKLQMLAQQLMAQNPQKKLHFWQQQVVTLNQTLINLMQAALEERRHQFLEMSTTLETLSPLKTLSRGYALIHLKKNSALVKDVSSVTVGDKIEAKLYKGKLLCTVDECVES